MLRLQRKRLGKDGNGITAAAIITLALGLVSLATTPVDAQSVIVVEGAYSPYVNQLPNNNAAPFIYGSPIPSPMPVNPSTGLTPNNNIIYSYPSSTTYYSYPARSRVEDSTLVNPVLVNPRIRDSTLVNPVIVNDRMYRIPDRYPRSRGVRIRVSY